MDILFAVPNEQKNSFSFWSKGVNIATELHPGWVFTSHAAETLMDWLLSSLKDPPRSDPYWKSGKEAETWNAWWSAIPSLSSVPPVLAPGLERARFPERHVAQLMDWVRRPPLGHVWNDRERRVIVENALILGHPGFLNALKADGFPVIDVLKDPGFQKAFWKQCCSSPNRTLMTLKWVNETYPENPETGLPLWDIALTKGVLVQLLDPKNHANEWAISMLIDEMPDIVKKELSNATSRQALMSKFPMSAKLKAKILSAESTIPLSEDSKTLRAWETLSEEALLAFSSGVRSSNIGSATVFTAGSDWKERLPSDWKMRWDPVRQEFTGAGVKRWQSAVEAGRAVSADVWMRWIERFGADGGHPSQQLETLTDRIAGEPPYRRAVAYMGLLERFAELAALHVEKLDEQQRCLWASRMFSILPTRFDSVVCLHLLLQAEQAAAKMHEKVPLSPSFQKSGTTLGDKGFRFPHLLKIYDVVEEVLGSKAWVDYVLRVQAETKIKPIDHRHDSALKQVAIAGAWVILGAYAKAALVSNDTDAAPETYAVMKETLSKQLNGVLELVVKDPSEGRKYGYNVGYEANISSFYKENLNLEDLYVMLAGSSALLVPEDFSSKHWLSYKKTWESMNEPLDLLRWISVATSIVSDDYRGNQFLVSSGHQIPLSIPFVAMPSWRDWSDRETYVDTTLLPKPSWDLLPSSVKPALFDAMKKRYKISQNELQKEGGDPYWGLVAPLGGFRTPAVIRLTKNKLRPHVLYPSDPKKMDEAEAQKVLLHWNQEVEEWILKHEAECIRENAPSDSSKTPRQRLT